MKTLHAIAAAEAAGIKLRSDIATSETKTAPRANGEAPRKRGRKAQTPAAQMLEMGEAG